MGGWGFILFEIFMGEALYGCQRRESEREREVLFQHHAFHRNGRLVYLPSRLFLGYLMGSVNDDSLNLVYNLADFVNKIAFCLAIWQSAKKDTMEKMNKEALLA